MAEEADIDALAQDRGTVTTGAIGAGAETGMPVVYLVKAVNSCLNWICVTGTGMLVGLVSRYRRDQH